MKKLLIGIFIVIAIVIVLVIFGGGPEKSILPGPPPPPGVTPPGVTPPPAVLDAWEKVRAADVAKTESGWAKPVYLGINKVNGWIDSLEITPDGKRLHYAFYPGPDLINDIANNTLKGEADIYYSDAPFEKHAKLDKYFMAKSPWSSCCVQLDADGAFWYHTNYSGRPGGEAPGNTDWHALYRNDQFVPLNEIGKSFGDVFYCAAKDELWGVRGEESAVGTLKILKNAKANGFKGKTESAPEPVRKGGQPFLTRDCNTLYFTTNLGDLPSGHTGPAIYRSTRSGNNWSQPKLALSGKTGVGEYTLTSDGKKAFFVQLFTNDKGELRIGAFSTEKN